MTNMNSVNTDVSVIIPMFHGAKYLENIRQIMKKNVETASGISIELVLVNDSPDDIPDFSIIENADYQTYTVLNDKNLGIQCARLQGVKHSHGKYLFFLDQDEIVSDDIIMRLYRAADGGEAAVSDWEVDVYGSDGISSFDMIADTGLFTIKKFCTEGNVIGPPGHCLIRRDCLPVCWTERIMKINGADDFLLWMGMLAEGRTFRHCDGKLYIHRIHPGSFSKDSLNMFVSENEAFKIAANEYGISGFWRYIHKRSISYRKLDYRASQHTCSNNRFIRRMCRLLYPEILAIHVLNKIGINV